MFGPYFALRRDLASFALGEVPMTGRPLLCAGPPRLYGSSQSLGARSRIRDRPLCAGHMIPVCPGLTLRWTETLPLEFGRRLHGGPSLTLRWTGAPPGSSRSQARSLARPVPRARSLDLASRGRDLPFYDGRVISSRVRPSGPRGQACPSLVVTLVH